MFINTHLLIYYNIHYTGVYINKSIHKFPNSKNSPLPTSKFNSNKSGQDISTTKPGIYDKNCCYNEIGGVYTLAQNGKFIEALDIIESLIVKHPNFYKLYSTKASIYFDFFYFQDAIDSCTHALKLKQNDFHAYKILVSAFIKLGRISDSLKYARELFDRYPNNFYSNWILGKAFTANGDYRKANKKFYNSLKFLGSSNFLYPDNFKSQILSDLGKIASKRHRFDKAIDFYNQAMDLNPNHINLYKRIAITYFIHGSSILSNKNLDYVILNSTSKENFKLALNFFDKFINKANIVSANIYSIKANCHLYLKEYKKARENAGYALDIEPNHKTAIQILSKSNNYLYLSNHIGVSSK